MLSHLKYRPDIDGLRGVAVLAVVAYHAFPGFVRGGFIGVDIFFVISGYLISTIIFENLDKGTFSFFEFYVRRINRIFPALLLVLIFSTTFGWFALLADEYKQLGKHVVAGTSFLSNLVLWSEAGYFDNSAETKPLLHLWSLGVEEQFYIIWPLILWFAWRRNFNLLTISVFLVITSFLLNIKGVKHNLVATFYSPQTRFWELLVGGIVAWIVLYKEGAYNNIKLKINTWIFHVIYSQKEKYRSETFADLLSFIGLFTLIFGFWRINKELSYPGMWALAPVLGAALIILAGSKAWVNKKIISNKIMVWFGLISFPLYLWHWTLLSFIRIVESELPSRNIRIAAIGLSIIFAWLTYRFIEYPMRFGKNSKTKAAVLIFLMIIEGYAGYKIFKNDGYEFRESIKEFANNKNELNRTPAIDDECLKYTGLKDILFPYCRFTNVNGGETVAVIGDSHAHVAYPGISEYLKRKGVNTVLLANSGCPPFMGSYTGTNQVEKDVCRDGTEQLLHTISIHKDITRVFVFTRGPIYNKGTEPLTGNKNVTGGNIIPIAEFSNSAQASFNRLLENGKSIFYITENPELIYSAEACLSRPFKLNVRDCSLEKKVVLERQADYLNAFNNLKNITVINSLSAFCPTNYCKVFDEDGFLLYADDDHISVAGSNFMVNKLLLPYLK